MRINNISKPSFKGYDAAPLKAMYMQNIADDGHFAVFREMQDVGALENIDVKLYQDNEITDFVKGAANKFTSRWAQDDKAIIHDQNGKKLATNEISKSNVYCFAKLLGIPLVAEETFVEGGNMFIGKNEKGEKWMLVGSKDYRYKEALSKLYGISKKNIFRISQPNFHLDMAIRPIGYPYILVNDPELALENSKKIEGLEEKTKKYYDNFNKHHPHNNRPYADVEKTIKELEAAGFKPIRIAGVYTGDINYMNALVSKREDGTMAYITNSTKGSNLYKTDDMFKEDLTKKVPNIDKVYFISGGKSNVYQNRNEMMINLGTRYGGIHCMTLEEPDFDKWA